MFNTCDEHFQKSQKLEAQSCNSQLKFIGSTKATLVSNKKFTFYSAEQMDLIVSPQKNKFTFSRQNNLTTKANAIKSFFPDNYL